MPRYCSQLIQDSVPSWAKVLPLAMPTFFPIDIKALLCSRFSSHFKCTLLLGVLWSLVVVCWTLTNPRSSEVAGSPGWHEPVAEGPFCSPCYSEVLEHGCSLQSRASGAGTQPSWPDEETTEPRLPTQSCPFHTGGQREG